MNRGQTNGIFFDSAILNDEWAKPAIDCPTPCTLRTSSEIKWDKDGHHRCYTSQVPRLYP